MSAWFGQPWPSAAFRAPICEDDDEHVPTPVGRPCLFCQEMIAEGDRGILMPSVTPLGVSVEPIHIECNMRSVMGGPAHVQGTCTCYGGTDDDTDLGMTPREAAIWVWDHYTSKWGDE